MSKKILLIDDDLFIRELYEEILKNEGYEVTVARDGKEGLDKIIANGYDLILLDVMMPKLDGIGVISILEEKNLLKKKSPIVILTNLARDPVIKDMVKRGIHSVLIKAEINPDQFVAHIASILGKK